MAHVKAFSGRYTFPDQNTYELINRLWSTCLWGCFLFLFFFLNDSMWGVNYTYGSSCFSHSARNSHTAWISAHIRLWEYKLVLIKYSENQNFSKPNMWIFFFNILTISLVGLIKSIYLRIYQSIIDLICRISVLFSNLPPRCSQSAEACLVSEVCLLSFSLEVMRLIYKTERRTTLCKNTGLNHCHFYKDGVIKLLFKTVEKKLDV